MSTENKSKQIKYIIITALVAIAIVVTVFVLMYRSRTNKPAELLFKEYEELESAYAKALSDIEKVSDADYSNLEEMRKELQGKINDLKAQKDLIDLRHNKSEDLYADLKQNLEKLKLDNIDSLKSGGNTIVFNDNNAAEVRLSTQDVVNMYNENEDLRKEKDELAKNLEIVRTYYEKEKSKNQELNDKVANINERMEELNKKGESQKGELEKLQLEKKTFEEKLAKSNKLIEQQNTKLNDYAAKLRKANINCYFVFEKGNAEKQTKITLDENGLTKMYYDYFVREHPPVHLSFTLNDEFLNGTPEKVTIRIINQSNVEVFSTSRTISKALLEVEVPGDKFDKGLFKVVVRSGNEDLLSGGAYLFKVLK